MEIGNNLSLPPVEDREQAKANAMSLLQARYGEKPKEARQIRKSLDKDDFLKIMLSEMKHQDPTKPMDADKMATQMAQLTSVEQLKNVGASIDRLVDKNNAADRLAMSSMIGKTVIVDKGKFSHSKGNISPLNYQLPEDAARIKLSILDEAGDEIFSKELEPQKKGLNIFNWDGMGSNGVFVKTGSYAVRLDAEKSNGAKMKIDPISKETVLGVSFDGGQSNFLVGNAQKPQRIAMQNVIRIEAQSDPVAPKAATPEKDGGFELPEELKTKIEASMPRNEPNEVKEIPDSVAAVAPEGFPNGLKE